MNTFETEVLQMSREDIALKHVESLDFSDACYRTVRDTEHEEVRKHILAAMWDALFN
jgi:hypothetical protein